MSAAEKVKNSSALKPTRIELTDQQRLAVTSACDRIAPTWPLDQMIAVNPWWELRDQAFADVSAKLSTLSRVRCLMPKSYFRDLWQTKIFKRHLKQAAIQGSADVSIEELLEHLQKPEWHNHWHNISDWLDSTEEQQHRMAWRDEISHQISQFCAEFFQPGTPFEPDAKAEGMLYKDWLEVTRLDKGIEILMSENHLAEQFSALPNNAEALLAQAINELEVDQNQLADYFHALLLDVNGWASWVAYTRWQAQLNGKQAHHLMQELLAVRLAWDLVLWRHNNGQNAASSSAQKLTTQWKLQWSRLPRLIENHKEAQRLTWVWQSAAELAYQESLGAQLIKTQQPKTQSAPDLQAVFCIDVRSEPMRRALEAQSPNIQTKGFAGFFGLPIEYQPHGTQYQRPQLPGLLKASISVSEESKAAKNISERPAKLGKTARWHACNDAPPATFSLVESLGLGAAVKLLRNSFAPGSHSHPITPPTQETAWALSKDGELLNDTDKAALAAGVLKAMGLTQDFADWVLIVGHGSSSKNNPHAAGLDCGACGGQTGEINARVLSSLLNDKAVRWCLSKHQINIPSSTQFLPALHNTTTDEINVIGKQPSEQVGQWLAAASEAARQERAPNLSQYKPHKGSSLKDWLHQRANDWSQVRPEWGLANNASFIVAPRDFTRNLDLAGRSFLHDYQWRSDDHFALLEQIMTAPMIVTHWINMQYNASVTDNYKYGSGNKVLHNVVVGNVGVFEGNGGDLRIGLPKQSVHDGQQWRHQPLRLSVFLAAPREAITNVVRKHKVLADLIDQDWLYVFQWNTEQQSIARFYQKQWTNLELNGHEQ